MIANLTAEIEAKDSLLADMVSAQEELNIQVMHARMQKRKRLETLFPDEDANSDTELAICVNIDDYDVLQADQKANVRNESDQLMEKLEQAKVDQKQEEDVPSPISDTIATHQKPTNPSSMDTFRSFFPLIDMRRVSAVLSSTVTAALPVSPMTDLAIQEEMTAEPAEPVINPSLSSIPTPTTISNTKKESEYLDQIKTLHLQQAHYKQELAKMTTEKSAALLDVQELRLRLGLAKTLNAKQAGDLNQCLDELQDVKSENTRLKQEKIVLVARLEKELVEEGNLHSLALLKVDEKVQEKEEVLRYAEDQILKLKEQLNESTARLLVQEQEKTHPTPISNESLLIAENVLLKSQLSAKESQFAGLLEDYSRQSTQLALAQSRITDLVATSTSLASDLQTLHTDKRFNILHIQEQHDKDVSLFKDQVSLISAQLSLCTARLETLTLDYTTQSTALTSSKTQIKDLLTTLQDLVIRDQQGQEMASLLKADLLATRRERDILLEMGAARLPLPPSSPSKLEIKSGNASVSSSTEEATVVGRDNIEEDKQVN